MTKLPIAFAAVLLLSGTAHAAQYTPTEIVQRHTSAGGDLDRLMEDYADDAVVFQQGRAIQGKDAIRALYARMFPPRPAGVERNAAASRPVGGMNVTRVWEEGEVALLQAIFMRGPSAPPPDG